MPEVVLIVCEFNPFHSGHAHLIAEVRRLRPDALIICLMSGNFVQRGSAAIAESHIRAAMGLAGGADVILELPFLFATQSAADFARGAVRIATQLGVNYLAFGAETADTDALFQAAMLIDTEPGHFSEVLRAALRSGHSHAAARQQALASISPSLGPLLSSANNILGIEYLQALRKSSVSVQPLIIQRAENAVTAHAIRRCLADASTAVERREILDRNGVPLPFDPQFAEAELFQLAAYRIRMLTRTELRHFADVTAPIASRLRAAAFQANSYDELVSFANTRWLTRSRIRRVLLSIVMNVDKDVIRGVNADNSPLHARLLGLDIKRAADFGTVVKAGGLTVCGNFRSLPDTLLARFDQQAADLYRLLVKQSGAAVHRVVRKEGARVHL